MNKKDITKVLKLYDDINQSITNIQQAVQDMMPLVADSLELTRKLIAVYKRAFIEGLQNGTK